MRTIVVAVVAVFSAVAAPCAAGGEVIKVSISDMTFSPAEVTVRVGDTVEWNNSDFVDHTATAKNSDWEVALPAGKSGGVELKHPGDVAYYCRFHPNMTGIIHVVAAGAR